MPTVRAITYELLRTWGLTTVFGNPGSNELPFLDGFPADFRYVLGLHEGAVLATADGYAQATGRPALVNLHSAAGLGNAMGNLANAHASRTPLVVTAGQQARAMIGLGSVLAEPAMTRVPEPHVKWACEPARAEDVPRALSEAFHLATLAPAGPVFVSLPMDLLAEDVDVPVPARSPLAPLPKLIVGELGRLVLVEAVGVLHGEFAPPHQAEARAALVAELGLDLVEVLGQLLVALELLASDVSDHFLAGRLHHEITAVAVLDAQQLGAHLFEPAGFLPEFGGLDHGHGQLHGACAVHLLAHNGFHLADHPEAHGHVVIDPGAQLLDQPRPRHEFVADHLGIRRGFLEGGNKELGGFHRDDIGQNKLVHLPHARRRA